MGGVQARCKNDARPRPATIAVAHDVRRAVDRSDLAVRDELLGESAGAKSRLAVWCLMEIVRAHLGGRALAQRDLILRSNGQMSPVTAHRIFQSLVKEELITWLHTEDRRVRTVAPTPRTVEAVSRHLERLYLDTMALTHTA